MPNTYKIIRHGYAIICFPILEKWGYRTVSLKKNRMVWHGFLLSRQKVGVAEFGYWALSKLSNCYRYEVAGWYQFADWPQKAKTLLGPSTSRTEWVESASTELNQHQFALVNDGRLDACLFVAPEPIQQSRQWLISAFAKSILTPDVLKGIISGKLKK